MFRAAYWADEWRSCCNTLTTVFNSPHQLAKPGLTKAAGKAGPAVNPRHHQEREPL